jgi:hypothetical protein
MRVTITRRAFVGGLALVFLLGTHCAPRCVRTGDTRRIYDLRNQTIYHLTRNC